MVTFADEEDGELHIYLQQEEMNRSEAEVQIDPSFHPFVPSLFQMKDDDDQNRRKGDEIWPHSVSEWEKSKQYKLPLVVS